MRHPLTPPMAITNPLTQHLKLREQTIGILLKLIEQAPQPIQAQGSAKESQVPWNKEMIGLM